MKVEHDSAGHGSGLRRVYIRKSLAALGALGVLSSLTGPADATGHTVDDRHEERGTLQTISATRPFHMVQSTGNLYWTVNTDANANGVAFSRIYRMSKQGAPGTERVLYQESHDGTPYFAALTYAKLGSRYYAFFVVNDPAAHTSVIKRVWLGGGPAKRIVTSPGYIWARDLVTDGTYLFWADEEGLNRSKIDGTGLATLQHAPGLGQVAVSAARVFWADDNDLRSALKVGADFAFELRAQSRITDLSVQFSDSSGYSILRGEKNGSVRASGRFGAGEVGYQSSESGRSVTSVFSGSRVFWTDCAAVGESLCRARVRKGQVQVSVPTGSFPDHIQGDASGMYWADAAGLRRFR